MSFKDCLFNDPKWGAGGAVTPPIPGGPPAEVASALPAGPPYPNRPAVTAADVGSTLAWRTGQLVRNLSQLGIAALRGGASGGDPLRFAWQVIYGATNTLLDSVDAGNFLAAISYQSKKLTLASLIGRSYFDMLSSWANQEATTLLGLTIVRDTLSCLEKAEWAMAYDGSSELSAGAEAKAELGGAGIGVGGSQKVNKAAGLKMGLKMYFVPLLERVQQCIDWVLPHKGISAGEVVDLWARGLVTDDLAEQLVRLEGVDWEEAQRLKILRQERCGGEEIIEYGRRAHMGDAWIKQQLQWIGVIDPAQQKQLMFLYDEVPPVTDLLRFAQRNVTVPAVVKAFGLDDEFDRFWQGSLKEGLDAQGVSEEWARLHWRAHWVTASIGQGQEAINRLRDGRVDPKIVFKTEDFNNLMRENDVLPFWRDRFIALAKTPIGIRFMREIFDTYVITDEEFRQKLMDLSYSEVDANVLLKAEQIMRVRRLATQGHGYTTSELQSLLEHHGITEDFARQQLKNQGYPQSVIDTFVEHVHDRQWAGHQTRMIAAWKGSVVSGETDPESARKVLLLLNIQPVQIDAMLEEWAILAKQHVHTATVSEMTSWLKHGLLSVADFAARLVRMGFGRDDALRVVTTLAVDMQAAQRKALENQVKAIQAASAAAIKVKQLQQQKAQAIFTHRQKVGAGLANAMDVANLTEMVALIDSKLNSLTATEKDKNKKAAEQNAARTAKARAKAAVKRTAAKRTALANP